MNSRAGEPRRVVFKVNDFEFDGLSMGPESGQLVLFLHGFPQFADAWTTVMHPIADAGFHTVAMNQRGYSSKARPLEVEEYSTSRLVSDVLGWAEQLGASSFHLVGHDWGGFIAWKLAAEHPSRLRSLSVIATAHVDAFLEAVQSDADQMAKSKYIQFFRMPGGAAESFFLANNAERLRDVYQGKVPSQELGRNVQRLSQEGALTAALNWYRAMDLRERIGKVTVPTLYVWGEQDLALGEAAALATANYVDAPYVFERLPGKSHWLLEEVPEELSILIEAQIARQFL